ncbi:hypothetical protein L9F63_016945, partial [Diploptera punctata]
SKTFVIFRCGDLDIKTCNKQLKLGPFERDNMRLKCKPMYRRCVLCRAGLGTIPSVDVAESTKPLHTPSSKI